MSLGELMELLSSPEEGPRLRPLLGGTGTDEDRHRYFSWLEGQQSPRGEVARRLSALERSPDAANRAALEEALQRVSGAWWALVRPVPWLLNCGEAAGQPAEVRFAYECPRSWETLEPTEEEGQRFCGRCRERVFLCPNREEAERQALAGRCIAVPSSLAREVSEAVSRLVVGRPHPPSLWADRLFRRR
jgi:hypothetical protein